MFDLTEIAVPGLMFPEGSRWHEDDFWFSDQLGGRIHRVNGSGRHDVVGALEHPSGLGFRPGDSGVLVALMHTTEVVLIGGAEPAAQVADLSSLALYLNDMFVDPSGRAYIDAYGEDLRDSGLILFVPGGEPRRVADGLAMPNGVAATPDGSTLLVSETLGARITAFDIAGDGSLSNRRAFAELPGRAPDGLCLDAEGAVWVGCYLSGEFIRVKQGGEITDRISRPGRWTTACALGGADGRTLLLCSAETDRRRYFAGEAVGHLETCQVGVPGVGRP
jgi:sugar lactone lactonase YvrE